MANNHVIGKVIKTSELPDGRYETLVELEAAKFKMQEGAKFTAFLATSVVKQRQLGEEPVLHPETFHFQTETPLTVRPFRTRSQRRKPRRYECSFSKLATRPMPVLAALQSTFVDSSSLGVFEAKLPRSILSSAVPQSRVFERQASF